LPFSNQIKSPRFALSIGRKNIYDRMWKTFAPATHDGWFGQSGMNFEFSEDVTAMREEVNRFLSKRLPNGAVRHQIESGAALDRELWSELASMGWLGVGIPEEFGGAGLGHETLCMIAEELGRALPFAPFSSSIFLAAQAILEYGSEAQKQEYLPGLADGSLIGTFALAEGTGDPSPDAVSTVFTAGKLTGKKLPVFDGTVANIAVVAARGSAGMIGLYITDLTGPGILRENLTSLDLTRPATTLSFTAVPAEPLPQAADWTAITRLLDQAAILFAFEAVGGAQAALAMALDYSKSRYAFGRPIAALQALKHKLADIYVGVELARSNAYFGAWALETNAPELQAAAAAARLSANEAFFEAARENIQVHGGMGFTWESDCHLYYRRSKQLAGNLGSARYWRNRLIDRLLAQNETEAA
jgi:alkylation response protein AidB-like acyl-CoA dehydrogenase